LEENLQILLLGKDAQQQNLSLSHTEKFEKRNSPPVRQRQALLTLHNTKKISATPENIEAHGAHPPNFGDATA
jgi:hypothetical protein